MELTDGVITLRSPADADADSFTALVRSSLPDLKPWMPWATDTYEVDDARAWIHGEYDPSAHSFLVIGETGEVIGACGLNQFDDRNQAANLGYWLCRSATGRGFATRATRLVARYGIEEVGLHRLEVVMSVENDASRMVAQRSGATLEGRLRGALLLQGRHHDAWVYSFVQGDDLLPGVA